MNTVTALRQPQPQTRDPLDPRDRSLFEAMKDAYEEKLDVVSLEVRGLRRVVIAMAIACLLVAAVLVGRGL